MLHARCGPRGRRGTSTCVYHYFHCKHRYCTYLHSSPRRHYIDRCQHRFHLSSYLSDDIALNQHAHYINMHSISRVRKHPHDHLMPYLSDFVNPPRICLPVLSLCLRRLMLFLVRPFTLCTAMQSDTLTLAFSYRITSTTPPNATAIHEYIANAYTYQSKCYKLSGRSYERQMNCRATLDESTHPSSF